MLLCTKMLPRLAVMLLTLLLVAPATAQGPVYLADVDDLPLAPGLVEDTDAGVAFDKPEGRIVQAVASGHADRAGVRAFYAETLPGLGWLPAGEHIWTRDRETLRMELERKDDIVVVRFAIAPSAP